jgi:flagellar export protein FliJ
MSTLDTLIRIHRWQLDEHRRRVAELEGLAATLRDDMQRLDAEQASEQEVVRRSNGIAYGYGSYTAALIERRQKLAKSLAEAEQRTTAAREALAAAFQEAKRYEIAAAKRALHQRMTEERIDQRGTDELAADIHRRSGSRLT